MRKAAFFAFFLLAYYLAGMYRSQPLMALCLGMLLLAGTAFLRTRQLRKGISASFPQTHRELIQGKEAVFPVCIENRRPLGAGRCILTLEAGYGDTEGITISHLESSVRYGATDLAVSLFVPDCGLLFLRVTALEGRDWFSLFRFKKRWDAETTLAVLPLPEERLHLSFFSVSGDAALAGLAKQTAGEDIHEIRQLREYRIGDQNRRIHWNVSARTGKLWLKELEGDDPPFAALYLRWGERPLSRRGKSDFFRLFHALAMGLLEQGLRLETVWRDIEGRMIRQKADSSEGVHSLLLSLYQLGAEGFPTEPSTMEDCQGAFMLDTELGWYWEEALIYRFSSDKLEEEIREKNFWL